MPPENFDVKDFVLLRKSLVDEYLKVTVELNKATLWLKAERDRLILNIEERERAETEMNVAAAKLMRLYKELKEENERLMMALAKARRPGKSQKEEENN